MQVNTSSSNGNRFAVIACLSLPYHPNDSWGLEGPLNHSTAGEVGITPLPKKCGDAKNDASIPPVFAGMDKAEALAYVSRLFDAAPADAVIWGDRLLLKRFLAQCSRSGSMETQEGYRRELRHLTRWRDQNHPHLHLRELDPALVDGWVSQLREQVTAEELKPRSFNRRISAVCSFYRWASEPTRSAVTGISRNPMPRCANYVVPKLAKPMSEDDLGMVLATIANAASSSVMARRDFVMVKGSYLLGCRVSELCRLRWRDIEPVEGGGQINLLGKGSKHRTLRVSRATLELFESLGRGEPGDWLFPSNKKNGPLTRQGVAARMARWGKAADVHLYPHRCRYTHATHAIRRGVDVFTLSATLGHSFTGTTSDYVLAEPGESSSLRLG